uniref:WAT1-related protein n=1 Tax=Rhizophora mucronata TaxID=61149 RepID=A0A2P2QRG5_RHIMU
MHLYSENVKVYSLSLSGASEMWLSGITVVMLAMEFLDVGMNTVCKAAMTKGMSQYVLVVYSNFLGIFFLLSSILFFYRKRNITPPISWSIICRIIILSVLGCCGQVFTYVGIKCSSPTLASAMIDLTPAFTFILATISRIERLNLRTKSSQAKSIGTLALITGGLIVTLYKGWPITIFPSSNESLINEQLHQHQSNWVAGGLFLAAHSLILAIMYNIQTWLIRDYPSELMTTLLFSIIVTILSAIVCLVAEEDPNVWRITSGIELIAIGYTAAFAVSIRTAVHAWACHKKGPVYTSMFKPLGMVIAVFMGVSFLGDTLHLGSVIGAFVIVLGFYAVIWGKAQEERKDDGEGSCCVGSQTCDTEAPLLTEKQTNDR